MDWLAGAAAVTEVKTPTSWLVVGATDPRGPVAESADALWQFMLWLGVATFVLFFAVLVLGLFRRRHEPGEEFPAPTDDEVGAWWLFGGGITLPTVVIGAVFAATVATMAGTSEPAPDRVVIEVTGH